jgi:hypothetical protein
MERDQKTKWLAAIILFSFISEDFHRQGYYFSSPRMVPPSIQ